jgi:peptide-methionine (S)-S-oxide reductase
METATLAGGCFWCTEAIFKRLKGVISVTVGYSGGSMEHPTMEQVYRGDTGHAESVQITYDPSIIPYEKLLNIFFHLHDPTTLNKQGNDVGTEYRSAIFYHTDEQKSIAEKLKKQIPNAVTEIVPYTKFYTAEENQQEYYEKNTYQPYCMFAIDPKIQKLLREFPTDVTG